MWCIWAIEAEVPWPNQPVDVVYNGRTFNLMPQTDEDFASIAVQAPIEDWDAVSKAVHRFLSVLAWVDGKGIRTLWNVGNGGWRQPTRRSPALARPSLPRPRSNFDFLPIPCTEQAAKALAFYREAVSTRTRDNEFLQLFRILELAYGHRKAEHPKFINGLIASTSLPDDARSAVETLRSRGINIGKQIVVNGRHAVAHGDDDTAIDPDIVSERSVLNSLMPIVTALAIHTIESHFGVPTRRTYYQRHEYEVEGFASLLSDELRRSVLSASGAPLAILTPIVSTTIGLRSRRYPAFTDLVVSEALMHDGVVSLRLVSSDNLVHALIHFDLINRRFIFDVERELLIKDDGASASAEHAADMFELLLGLVGNGELHAWDGSTNALLGRQNPNLSQNLDPAVAHTFLNARILEWREKARTRREAEAGSGTQARENS